MEYMSTYKCIHEGGTGEIEEKKSRFIANVASVETEEEASAFIAEIKKKYWDARHNCSAFVIGKDAGITRCSDDGEPAGSAGRPMLEVLLSSGIRNVCVVVTRYFGGTLLGVGGLIRAYQGALKEGLKNSVIKECLIGTEYKVTTDYNGAGKLQYLFAENEVILRNSEWGADVIFTVILTPENEERILKAVTETTAGRAKAEKGDTVTVGVLPDGTVI